MSTTFTASNGVEIEPTETGCLGTGGSIGLTFVGPMAAKALREYFQHERDRELNRWRDPDNRDLVVYRMPELDYDEGGRAVQVMDETSGEAGIYWENRRPDWENKEKRETADRYLSAHPEPRPWEEAEPGEAWVLTIDGSEEAAMLMYSYGSDTHEFYIGSSDSLYSRSDPSITAGHRIWPEEGSTK